MWALAILLLAIGEYVLPGLPVAAARTHLQELHDQDTKLNQEVSALQVYERRYAEFQQEMVALNKQLDTLKTIVPEEKQTDEFMHLLQGAAAASGVSIRKLTAMPRVVSRDYRYEMPFQIQVDGPYYNIVDFFSRLSRLSQDPVNVGDLKFDGLSNWACRLSGAPEHDRFPAIRVVTTFFASSSLAPLPTKGGARPGPAPPKPAPKT